MSQTWPPPPTPQLGRAAWLGGRLDALSPSAYAQPILNGFKYVQQQAGNVWSAATGGSYTAKPVQAYSVQYAPNTSGPAHQMLVNANDPKPAQQRGGNASYPMVIE